MRQALHLLNSSDVERKVVGSKRLARLLKEQATDDAVLDELYWAALSRPPTAPERAALTKYLAEHKAQRAQALQDVLWALVNTKEFLFKH